MAKARLVPCSSCARHVRAAEKACPFCAAALTASDVGPVTRAPGVRLSRAALFALGTTVAACSSGTPLTTGDGGSDDGGATPSPTGVPAYGGPQPIQDASTDEPRVQPVYGGPPTPIDGGHD